MSDSSSALGPSTYIQNTHKYTIFQNSRQNRISAHVMTYRYFRTYDM